MKDLYHMQAVTRKVVLIGCPGEGESFLDEVKHDLNNYKSFFLSERGGSFTHEEIHSLINPDFGELCTSINGTTVDYMIVCFSGHGFSNHTGERMLSANNYSLRDTDLLSHYCPRQLVVIDACRNYPGARIGGIPGLGQDWDYATGPPTREIFDQWILESPYGHRIIHGTGDGFISEDTPSGGVFSTALIQTANNYIPADGFTYSPVMIEQLLTDVNAVLKAGHSHQHPCIVYETGDLRVPFAIGKLSDIPAVANNENIMLHQDLNNNNKWLAVIGLGLLCAAIISLGK